ncbi:MAG: phenylalanine--tRNA ligase subunit beta [Phycisphaerae bacterium]
MKVLLSWLKDYVDIDLSAPEVAEILSNLGFPNEGIEFLDNDAVIDLEVTSNRGDCLGYIGVARELAVATGKQLNLPKVQIEETDKDVKNLASVEIEEPDLCGRYTARVIEDVKIAPSPDWMKNRLEAIGMRSVNNVVDATNYAMMETGQPPHAFDYNKITDGKIIVRKAKPGERIISIDGSKCELSPNMLVITDPRGPVAIAGVMGGLETEVNDNTKNILLEDAFFNPVSIRTTSRALTLPSEAAFRFERIVDIENIDWASKRTAQLIVQTAGGKIAKGVADTYPKKPQTKKTSMRLTRLNALLGIEVAVDEVMNILSGLGFEPNRTGDVINCTVPSWRNDVYREADLIEEISRVYGYCKVPVKSKIEIEVAPVDKRQKMLQTIGKYLNGCGFYETINVSFTDNESAKLFAPAGNKYLSVKEELRKDSNLLRQTLAGSLLGVMKINFNAKNRPCRVFEIANTFVPKDKQAGQLPLERTMLALACDSNLRDMRGVIEGLIELISKESQVTLNPAEFEWAQAGAEIIVNDKKIGSAGIISEKIKEHFDLKDASVSFAEMDFNMLMQLPYENVQIKSIPRFPAIERDLSLVLDEQTAWSQIINSVNSVKCGELQETRFVDIYRGKGIPQGKKSLTLTLIFRDEDGTLKHETVDGFEKNILESIKAATGAELRSL